MPPDTPDRPARTAPTSGTPGQSRGAGSTQSRILRTGSRVIVAHGLPLPVWQDLYHRALVVSWPMFFVSLAVLFLMLNTTFATLYLLGHASIANQAPQRLLVPLLFTSSALPTVV